MLFVASAHEEVGYCLDILRVKFQRLADSRQDDSMIDVFILMHEPVAKAGGRGKLGGQSGRDDADLAGFKKL